MKPIKNLLSFLLVLALTIGAVAALSMATQAKTDNIPVASHAAEVKTKEVAELSAAIPEAEAVSSPIASVGAFILLLSIPVSGLLIYLKARQRGKDYRDNAAGRRYSPKADMSLPARYTARSRV